MSNNPLRLDDLMSRGGAEDASTKLMNVKVPTQVLERVADLAKKLRTSKTEVVVAILNEGLDKADSELKGWKAPPKPVIPKGRRCTVKDCDREKSPLPRSRPPSPCN